MDLFKPGSPYSAKNGVYGLVIRLWKRFFQPLEHNSGLWNAVMDYCNRAEEFSDSAMFLQDRKKHTPKVNLLILQ
jgi:hypothetical protein